jgi:hypothetical protein
MTVVVNGVPNLLARLAAAGIIGEAALTVAVDGIGAEVRDEARRIVPFVSGDLHDSILYEDGVVYSDLPYAAIVEYGGTHNDTPDPYMRPAADTVDETRAIVAAKVVMDRA